MKLENIGSLITYKDKAGYDRCLGSLMPFKGHGVYDPTLGKVEVTKEDALLHNKALETAMIEGLDENCAVGQSGTFYLINGIVQTFSGMEVSRNVTINGNSITFQRAGKTFRGRLKKHADCFNFRRVK